LVKNIKKPTRKKKENITVDGLDEISNNVNDTKAKRELHNC